MTTDNNEEAEMSELVSLHNSALEVACPKCGAETGKRCRTLTTGRSTDIHEARWLRWLNRVPGAEDTQEG